MTYTYAINMPVIIIEELHQCVAIQTRHGEQ
jgi:hypothetical protein